jgi:transcriptional regulator with XRE-family HTH domain
MGPTSIDASEIDAYADMRELETLRRALRRELEDHPGQDDLARVIGVGRSVLRKFLEQRTRPRLGALMKIRRWAEDRPPMFVPLGSVILATAVHDLPGGHRARARRDVAEALLLSYQRAGVPLPDWLREEARLPAAADKSGDRARGESIPCGHAPRLSASRLRSRGDARRPVVCSFSAFAALASA